MNEVLRKVLTNKFLIIFLFVIILIFVIGYLRENSRLEINNPTSEDVVLFIEGQDYQRKLELKPQEKIELRLKKDIYSLEATSADKQTRYIVELNHLLKKTVLGLDLKSVNSGIYLGESEFKCAREINSQPVFYSCSPSKDGIIESSGTVGLSPLLQEESSSEASQEEIVETKASLVIKPYKNVFLELKKLDSRLFISKRDSLGYTEPSVVKIENFQSEISDSIFYVDESSDRYAIIDKGASQIIYGSIGLKEQKRIDYSINKIDPEPHELIVGIGGEKIYLLAIRSSEHIENHLDEEDVHEAKPQIIVYSAVSGKEEKKFDINETATVSGISFGPGGLLYFIGNKSEGEGGGAFFLKDGTNLESFKNFGNGVNPPCWADKNSFYYVDVEGDSIYKYLLDKKAAYLIYQNNSAQNFITGISCADQSLYFSIASQADGELNILNHYKLGEVAIAGRPAEEVLPKYFIVGNASFKAGLIGNKKILIELIYNPGSDAPINNMMVQEKLREDLVFEGVNLEGFQIVY